MDFKDEILRELLSKPGMEALPIILDNWMTRKKNIEANCNCFNLLKQITSECNASLSPEHNELVNICGGLYQRGLFNLTWTMILDNFVEASTATSGGQKGGVKLQDMISYLFFAYTLLGVSEGIDYLPPAPSPYMSASNTEIQIPSSPDATPKPVRTIRNVQDLDLVRAETAEETVNKQLKNMPWLVDKEILIAKDVNVTQADAYEGLIEQLNEDIANAGSKAVTYCTSFAKKAEKKGYFTSTTDYDQLKKRTQELMIGPAPTATETLASYAFGMFSATPSPENLYSLTSGIAPPAGEEMAIRQALEEQEISKKISKTPFHEEIARSNKFMGQCVDISIPLFKITREGADNSINIYLQTKVGNAGTIELYKSLMDLEHDIKSKVVAGTKDDNSRLYETAQQLVEVITTGTVFVPIYSAPKSKNALTSSIVFATEASEAYKSAVFYLSFKDPRTEFESRDEIEIRKQTEARAAESRAQYFAEVSAPAKEVLTKLGHGAAKVAESLENVTEYAADKAEAGLARGIGIAGDAIFNVSDATLDVTGNVLHKGSSQAAGFINNLLMPVGAAIGLMGIAMILIVWFKKSMFTLKSNDPNTQQLINQVNALQAQIAAQGPAAAQPLALPAPPVSQLEAANKAAADAEAREHAAEAYLASNPNDPSAQTALHTAHQETVDAYKIAVQLSMKRPGGGTLKRKKRTRKQKRRNKNTKVKRRTSVRYQ